MSLLLSDGDVRRAVNYQELINSIEAALKVQAEEDVVMPPRMNLEYSATWMRIMPCIAPAAGVMGLKIFHGTPGRGARYLVLLYAMSDGAPLAAVDGCYLTAARTAATTAVASRYLLPSTVARLGVIGSGLEAEAHCEALCASGQVREIKVFSPNEARRTAFANRIQSALSIPVAAVARAEDAVADVDHAVIATNTGPSQAVACYADWLSPGQHVSSIGSTNTRLRELETEVFDKADLVVLDANAEQMIEESGDLIQHAAEGRTLHTRILTDLVGGKSPGRESASELTLYKSVGTALQDVVAANYVYRRALELGLGVEVADLSQEKLMTATTPAESA